MRVTAPRARRTGGRTIYRRERLLELELLRLPPDLAPPLERELAPRRAELFFPLPPFEFRAALFLAPPFFPPAFRPPERDLADLPPPEDFLPIDFLPLEAFEELLAAFFRAPPALLLADRAVELEPPVLRPPPRAADVELPKGL